MFEGAQHIYIPDFLVIYDGVIKSIWEVKRDDFLISDAKTIAKMDALEIYCRENDFNMFIVNSKILKRLQNYIKGIQSWIK